MSLRRTFHQEPELTWQEYDTATRIRAELDRLMLPWRACAKTGTIVDLGPVTGSRLALRADIDALPLTEQTGLPWASQREGCMHACGHDGHTATLLAAASWLATHRDQISRPIRLLFQPAEEGGHGAKAMIEDGALEGVDVVFGYHNLPTMPLGKVAAPAGTVMVSNAGFEITITGKGGHASMPESCKDPVLAAAQFTVAVQQIVSRNVAPQVPAVVTVASIHGGTASNIIPESVELTGTIRAGTTAIRDAIACDVEALLAGCCQMSGVSGSWRLIPHYPATVNHAGPAQHLRGALAREFGDDCETNVGVPLMGAEDFSYYLEACPGAYALIGTGAPEGSPPLHSPHFDYNDAILSRMARVWADLCGVTVDER